MVELALGLRVVRGPDWEWGDQDGGEGFVGTVAGLEEGGGGVIVQWDMGQRSSYRCGRDYKFDLRVLDSGPSGHTFSKRRCHVCRKRKVYGAVWRCLHCPAYYLCSVCYLANHHCSLHRFSCLLDRDGKEFRVPPREESRCVPARGLFPGAEVVRGADWRWKDQDGGEGKRGKVVEVLGWSSERTSVSESSVVAVVWESGSRNKYRAGHKGKVDVRCTSPGTGGFYYPEHLPVLGKEVEPLKSEEIVTGDRVKCEVDPALFGDPEMADKIGLILDHVGTVNVLLSSGEVLVRYPGNSVIPVNPATAKKVDLPVFEPGDVVRMISDMAEVYRLQQRHGEWNDDMALCLDQVGRVVKTSGDASVLVSIAGYRWLLNPHCLRHAAGEELSPDTNPAAHLTLLGGDGLGLLIDSIGPSLLVHATAKGDIPTIQAFLEKYPHQVNTVEQGKTAVHVAVEETRLKALEVVLKFKPNLSKTDSDGDAPLHTCAYHNAIQAAEILLEAGADVNSKNSKRGITPIMIAGAVGHIELMEIMATHHTANVNVQDSMGQTALHHILASQRTRAIPILLTAGADLTLLNSNFFTPLMEATGHGSLPGVEDILRQSPETVNWRRPTDSLSPLHLAGVRDKLFLTRHLALSGCDMNCKSDRLRTALHTSSIEGHSAVMECLVGFGVDINARDSDGNTVLHVVFVNKNSRPLSDFTPQINKVREELVRLPVPGPVPLYLTVGCFLIQEGANPCVRNNLGQTPAQICPDDKKDILLNYINKSNRGEFHGSLRRDRAAAGSTTTGSATENKPSVMSGPEKVPSDSATPQQRRVVTASEGSATSSSDRSGDLVSIMEAQHQAVGGGGGGGGHRERDRLRLQVAKRKEEETSHGGGEPQSLSAEEVRKRRQAYFASQAAKSRATAVEPTGEEDKVEAGNLHLVRTAGSKRETQQAARAGNPGEMDSEGREPRAGKLADNEVRGSVSKPTAGTRGANSVKDDSGHQQKRRVNENREQVQTKAVGVGKERGRENQQSRQQDIGVVRTTGTGKGTSALLYPGHQVGAKNGASPEVLCFICESPADARFTSCGHTVACKTCASQAKRCPICRVVVGGVS